MCRQLEGGVQISSFSCCKKEPWGFQWVRFLATALNRPTLSLTGDRREEIRAPKTLGRQCLGVLPSSDVRHN